MFFSVLSLRKGKRVELIQTQTQVKALAHLPRLITTALKYQPDVNMGTFSLYRNYSYQLTLSNVGEPKGGVEFLGTISRLRKRNKISSLGGVYMRKLAPARVSYRHDFLISYRLYMMTGLFHISLFEGTLHVDKMHV